MRTQTRTTEGTEYKDVWYALEVRHESVLLYSREGVFISEHITMEESRI